MARFVGCPGCAAKVDVTPYRGGGRIPCPGCGTAIVVPADPSSKTGVAMRAPAPPPRAERPAAPARKPTGGHAAADRAVRRSAAASRGPLFILIGIVVLLGGGLLIFALSSKGSGAFTSSLSQNMNDPSAAPPPPGPRPTPPPPVTPAPPAPETSPPPTTQPEPTGPIQTEPPRPETPRLVDFETGAARLTDSPLPRMRYDPALGQTFDGMLQQQPPTIPNPHNKPELIPVAIDRLLSDEPRLARAAFGFLATIWDNPQAREAMPGENPFRASDTQINSSQFRADLYDWIRSRYEEENVPETLYRWACGREMGGPTAADGTPTPAFAPPAAEEYAELLGKIRTWASEGDEYDLRIHILNRIQAAGEAAYPILINLIGDEDLVLGQTAVRVLNQISGHETPIPRLQDRDQIKRQWENWLERRGDSDR